MDVNLFYAIKEYYKNNIQLRCTLLTLFVRMLKYERKTETIEQLHTLFKTSSASSAWEKSPCFSEIVSLLDKAMPQQSGNGQKMDAV